MRKMLRQELPPVPGHPVYGPAAREEAQRLMREARQAKINLGWPTKLTLCKVARGEKPLSFDVWQRARDYVAQVRRTRDLAERPWRIQLIPGQAVRVVRREVTP